MKKLSTIILSLFFIGVISAQKWKGSTTINGNLYRNGNVGIGTKNPNATLQVGDSNHSGSPINEIEVKRLSLAPVTHSGSDWFFTVRDNKPYANLDLGYSNRKSLTIRHDGNIGIGAKNPNATLQVGDSNHSGSPIKEIEVKRLSLAPVTHSGSDWFFTVRDNKPYANLDLGYSNRKSLTIRHDGNVGIGVKNPTTKLAVNGKVRAKEVVVETGWSDFVFEKDYKLPTLKEVEQHIKKHGHLKDIPSAKEVAEKGVKLGQMDSKLLQKIEELTLYIIKQNKRIELLESKLNQN